MTPERLRPLLDKISPLGGLFSAAGHRLYLVGGCVRDLFGGLEVSGSDLDFTTDALPDEVQRVLTGHVEAMWDQGARFGTIAARWRGHDIEVTTHRAEAYVPESRKPDVRFSRLVTDDLSRRDFTINAMALEVTGESPELLDPFGGLADLAARRLRTPLTPSESFSDDPLRMLRAARFVARLEMTPDADLVAAVEEMSGRIAIVSAERIRDELNKLMVVPDPSVGLWFLHDTGLADHFFPELPGMRLEQDPIHRHKDVLTHTIAVVAKTRPELVVRLAALFHDIGKPGTRNYGPRGVTFHHHEVVGARLTRDRMRALRYPNETVEDVSRLVFLHLRFHTFRLGWTDAAVRRFVRDAGPLLDELIELTRCDCTTRNRRKAQELALRMDQLEERIAELREREELDSLRPDLNGRQVMDHLGLAPGRAVGAALEHLLEIRLEEGPLVEDEAFRRLDSWWRDQGHQLIESDGT